MPDSLNTPTILDYGTPETKLPDLFDIVAPSNLPLDPSPNNGAPSGESITDIINDINNLQAGMSGGLSQSKTSTPFDYNEQDVHSALSEKLNPKTPSIQAFSKSTALGTEADYNRYKDSAYFQTLGYDSRLGLEQEYSYGKRQTWGDTLGNAFYGGIHLAADTFVEGWKGWGRMADALISLDSSKLMGSEEERYNMAKEQEAIMNKYAIYDTAESKDSLWNRQLFGNMLQQSGFAIGAMAQFAMEEFLTAGAASFLQPALKGVMVGRVVKGVEELSQLRKAAGIAEKTTMIGRGVEAVKDVFRPKVAGTVSELINKTRQASDVITKQPRIADGIVNGFKKIIPGYGTVDEFIKLNKAGAGYAQLAYTGLGGIKRGLSEFNMSRSESIYEAASTYKQLKDKLVEEYTTNNGRPPEGDELERIKQSAENASHDNFYTNIGVLSVMNRIQFDNMFKGFGKTRSLLGEGAVSLEGKAFGVSGKIAGKAETRFYKTGMFGRMGAIPEIAKTFGKKTAAWEATKSLGKGLMKFEGSEGMQELIQTASSEGLDKYYTDLYHGKKGFTGRTGEVMSALKNDAFTMEGMKTFLMGALTGRLISPITGGIGMVTENIQDRQNTKKAAESYKELLAINIKQRTDAKGSALSPEELTTLEAQVTASTEYKSLKDKVNESVSTLNALATNKEWFKDEAIANVKVQNKAAETMEEAAKNHDRYVFNNAKDSAFAKAIASAIKLDLYDSVKGMLQEYGKEMSDEDFKQAFGIDATTDSKKNVKNLTSKMVASVEDYYDTFKKLKDKYSDLIIPELYKNNKPEDYRDVTLQKAILDDAIEMMTTNTFKAKQTVIRAQELQSEIGQNKNIGASSIQVLQTLGSEEAIDNHIRSLTLEIGNLQLAPTLTPEQRELFKSKKEELELAQIWKSAFEDIMTGQAESYFADGSIKNIYKAFEDLINHFNKSEKKNVSVSAQDVEENFTKFLDYIKLNQDGKSYVDALNILSDPKNMTLLAVKKMQGYNKAAEEFFKAMDADIKSRLDTLAKEAEEANVTIKTNADGTFAIVDPDGIVVEDNIATIEEAEAKKKELIDKIKALTEVEKPEEKLEKPEKDIEAKKIDIEKARNKELVDKRPTILALDENGNLIAVKNVPKNNADIHGMFGGGIQGSYQQIFDALEIGINIIGGLKSSEYNILKPFYDKGLIKSKIDVYHRLNEPAINAIYDAQLDALEGKSTTASVITDGEFKDKINLTTNIDELSKLMEDIDNHGFTQAQKDSINKVFDTKNQELIKAAIKAGTFKIIDEKSIEFVLPYNEQIKIINDLIDKPTVTEKEVKDAYNKLTPIINKLSDEQKAKYINMQEQSLKTALEKIKNDFEANDIEGAKKLITNLLSSSTGTLNDNFDAIYFHLNLKLKPELKEEAIKHFEEEYLKAIDKKIKDLNANKNASVLQNIVTSLKEGTEKFKNSVQNLINKFNEKATKLAAANTNDISYIIPISGLFSNPTYRKISKETEENIEQESASSPQIAAIDSFTNSKLLTQEDIPEGRLTRQEANEIINTALGRMFTLQIYSALKEHFKEKGNSTKLKSALKEYLVSIDDRFDEAKTKEQRAAITKEIDETIANYLDKDIFPDEYSILNIYDIPSSDIDITDEEYRIFNEYRQTYGKLMGYVTKLNQINNLDAKYKVLLEKENTPTDKELISEENIGLLKTSITEGLTVENLQKELLDLFNEIKDIPELTIDQLNVAIEPIYLKYFEKNYSGKIYGRAFIRQIIGNSLEILNIKEAPEQSFEPLTDVEILSALNNTTKVLSDQQIAQVETYAKEDQLKEYKAKLYNALGYVPSSSEDKLDELPITIVPVTFNSLRPKFATDTRTTEDLSTYLMPDENGKVITKVALNYIIYSEHATDAEKELAKKLFAIASDDDLIQIDNNIKAAGDFDPATNEIRINLDATGYKKDIPSSPLETVILHELIHGLIEKAIADPKSEYAKSIKKLYDLVKTKDGASTFYAYNVDNEDEQIREFVTEAFTNPAFQYLLASTPYKNTRVSLWDKFMEVINAVLTAIGVDMRDTALSEVLSLTDELFNRETIIESDKFPSEAIMEKIKLAKTEEELDQIKTELKKNKDSYTKNIFNALGASIDRKLVSIKGVRVKSTYKTIKIDNITYHYAIENNRLKVFKIGNYKLNAVKNAKVLDKIVNQILSKQKITEILSAHEIEVIKDLGGDPQRQGTYASGLMVDDLTEAEAKYPNVMSVGSNISIRFNNNGDAQDGLEQYKQFKKDWVKYKKNIISLKDLKDKYSNNVVNAISDLQSYLEGSSTNPFKYIDKLIAKGYITLTNNGYPALGDITYDTGLSSDELLNYYKDVVDGVQLNKSEFSNTNDYINKTLSRFFGTPISQELQRKLENDIFRSSVVEEDEEPEVPEVPEAEDESTEKVTIISNLANSRFVFDPSSLTVRELDPDASISAIEPNALRSKTSDGYYSNGQFIEHDSFKNYYFKIRNIINKLVKAPLTELEGFHVTLDKDSANLRWDGSAESDGWKNAKQGIVGYISDENGNPIIFNKEGKKVGVLDRTNLSDKKGLDTGENQIIYFSTATKDTKDYEKETFNPESLSTLIAIREKVMAGKPQIGKLEKITKGQIVLKGLVKPGVAKMKNTVRDKEFNEQLKQDHVTLELNGEFLNAVVLDSEDTGHNTALFTPSSKNVKVLSAEGELQTMFDHLVDLMEVYHQMVINKDPNIGDIQNDLVRFAQNIFYSGTKASIQMHGTLKSITLNNWKNGKSLPSLLALFDKKDLEKGIVTRNEENIKRLKSHIDNMKINISKMWLDGKQEFKFPYIKIVDGKKSINFEKKDYKTFLMDEVGLLSYVSDIPIKKDLKAYHSMVHFTEPVELNPTVPTIVVTKSEIIKNDDAVKDSIDKASTEPLSKEEEEDDIPLIDPTTIRFNAPLINKIYEKTC